MADITLADLGKNEPDLLTALLQRAAEMRKYEQFPASENIEDRRGQPMHTRPSRSVLSQRTLAEITSDPLASAAGYNDINRRR